MAQDTILEEIEKMGITPFVDESDNNDSEDQQDSNSITTSEQEEENKTITPANKENQENNSEDSEDSEEDVDYLKQFAAELGYDEEVNEDGLAAFVSIAKNRIEAVKSEYAVYEDEDVRGLAEFKKQGGSLQTYLTKPEESNVFAGIKEVVEDDVEQQEQLAALYFEEKGFDPSLIPATIEALKANDKLFDTSKQALAALQQQEAAYNTKVKADFQANVDKEIADHKAYFTGLEEVLNQGLSDIALDSTVSSKLKSVLLPDKSGSVAFDALQRTLTPAQHARVQAFVVSLVENKKFAFNPGAKIKEKSSKGVEIAKMFATSNSGKSGFGTAAQLNSLLKTK